MMKRNNTFLILLLLIIVLGSFLRIYQLSDESIWLDEAWSVQLASEPLMRNITDVDNYHPPLYQVCLHFWMKIFGLGESATRSLSVIFGIISIYLIYKVAKALFGKNVGLISAFLFSISGFQIRFAQEARDYALLTMLSLLSLYFFIKIINKGKIKHYFYYFISTILLLYTHNYALFVIFAQNMYLVLFYKRYQFLLRRWSLIQLLVFLSFLPWLLVLIKQIKSVHDSFWLVEPEFKKIIQTFEEYIGCFVTRRIVFPYFALFFFGFFNLKKRKGKWNWRHPLESLEELKWEANIEKTNSLVLLAVLMFCIIAIPFIISRVYTPIYITRYTIAASIAFYIIVAKGISNLKGKFLLPIVICLILILNYSSLEKYYSSNIKEEWRAAVQYLEEKSNEDDIIFICHDFCIKPFTYYYRDNLEFIGIKREITDFNELDIIVRNAFNKKTKRMWLILSHQNNSPIKEYIQNSTQLSLLDKKEFVGIELSLFEYHTM